MSNRLSIENISTIILELFVVQDNKDVRVTLNPGEKNWCDADSSTKSMILYERKNLIKISTQENKEDTLIITVFVKPQEEVKFVDLNFKVLPTGAEFENVSEDEIDEDESDSEEEKDSLKKETKKYKGKKRGRKKKRGPKPGAKKKKAAQLPTMTDFNPPTVRTGTTNC